MRIGFDVDGVLYPFEDCFRDWMKEKDPEGHEMGRYDAPATRWEFYEDWGLTLDEFKADMAAAARAGHLYRSQFPYTGATSVLAWCRSYKHTVHLVTHRAEFGAMANTERWIEQMGLVYDTVTFAHDKSIIDADVLIEDRPENLQVWLDRTGKPGIIFTRPWNEDWDHDAAGAVRVGSYEQLRHVLRSVEIGLKNDAITEEIVTTAQVLVDDDLLVPSATLNAVFNHGGETVLEEAQRLIYGNRQEDYGHPIDDFTKTAGMWSAAFGWEVEPEDVAMAMIMVKISREKNRPKRDNAVDIAGYAGTLAMVREAQERT